MVRDHAIFANVYSVLETELIGDASLGTLAQAHFAGKTNGKVVRKFY